MNNVLSMQLKLNNYLPNFYFIKYKKQLQYLIKNIEK